MGVLGPNNMRINLKQFEAIEPLKSILPWILPSKMIIQNMSYELSFISWFRPLLLPSKMMPCRRHLTLPLCSFGPSSKDLLSNLHLSANLGGPFPFGTLFEVTLIQLYWKLEPTHPNQPPHAHLAICRKNQLLKFMIPLTER